MLPRFIELETSRQCNRRCGWCPNGTVGGRDVQDLMPWEMFTRFLGELAAVSYDGWLALHNFNEPLMNDRLDREIREITLRLPSARPIIFSNGDFLDAARCLQLQRAGVHTLRVTLYPSRPQIPSASQILGYLEKKGLKSLGEWAITESRQGLSGDSTINEMAVEVIAPDVARYGQRGGTAAGLSMTRTSPCPMTSHSAAIDYRGRMKMCCNVVPDAEGHGSYVIGDLTTSSFLALWEGSRMNRLRVLHSDSDWSETPICETCVQQLPASEILATAVSQPPPRSSGTTQ